MEKTYFYHSPQIKGERRHTIAGVLKNGKMSLGVASCSLKDNFVKAKGRELALKRAQDAENGQVVLGKNSHVGIVFRGLAISMAASMLSDKVDFNMI